MIKILINQNQRKLKIIQISILKNKIKTIAKYHNLILYLITNQNHKKM
jgi:hypothetical protein